MAKKCVVCNDCDYNVMKQLVKLNQLLWNIETYIEDAEKTGHKECLKVFEKIRDDTVKNAGELKKLLASKAKNGLL